MKSWEPIQAFFNAFCLTSYVEVDCGLHRPVLCARGGDDDGNFAYKMPSSHNTFMFNNY